MSIFGKIAAAIFGGAANASELPNAEVALPKATPVLPTSAPTIPTAAAASQTTSSVQPTSASMASAPAAAKVDVAKVLDAIDADEDLDWRKSIVDLMKLLKLDSSLKARKALAAELNYTGDTSDSASMNIWLHKQVMTKLAENGGLVPKELKH